ncbi:MAG: hypothetical protein WC760_03025 [Bacteroidia bacterium]|jgi:hypothetical protein
MKAKNKLYEWDQAFLGLPMKDTRWKVSLKLALGALTFMVVLFVPSPRFAAGFPHKGCASLPLGLSLSLLPECFYVNSWLLMNECIRRLLVHISFNNLMEYLHSSFSLGIGKGKKKQVDIKR